MSRQDKSFGTIGTMTGEHKIITSLIWLTGEILVAGTSANQLQFIEGGDPKINFEASTVSFIDLEKAKERFSDALFTFKFSESLRANISISVMMNCNSHQPDLFPQPNESMSIAWHISKMVFVIRFATVCLCLKRKNRTCDTRRRHWLRFRWNCLRSHCLPSVTCRWMLPWIPLLSQRNTARYTLQNCLNPVHLDCSNLSFVFWGNRSISMALSVCRCAHGSQLLWLQVRNSSLCLLLISPSLRDSLF